MPPAKTHEFKLKDPNSVYGLSRMLAQHFPTPEDCVIGIYELLLNAIEHGNLDIDYTMKTELMRQGKWQEEINRRLASPEYAGKEVEIKLVQAEDECRVTIADHGKGFVWQNYINAAPDSQRPNGRGLAIALSCKFDRIIFNPTGNEVTCIAQIPRHR